MDIKKALMTPKLLCLQMNNLYSSLSFLLALTCVRCQQYISVNTFDTPPTQNGDEEFPVDIEFEVNLSLENTDLEFTVFIAFTLPFSRSQQCVELVDGSFSCENFEVSLNANQQVKKDFLLVGCFTKSFTQTSSFYFALQMN